MTRGPASIQASKASHYPPLPVLVHLDASWEGTSGVSLDEAVDRIIFATQRKISGDRTMVRHNEGSKATCGCSGTKRFQPMTGRRLAPVRLCRKTKDRAALVAEFSIWKRSGDRRGWAHHFLQLREPTPQLISYLSRSLQDEASRLLTPSPSLGYGEACHLNASFEAVPVMLSHILDSPFYFSQRAPLNWALVPCTCNISSQ